MLTYSPTPIQEIQHPALAEAKLRLLIKREDLNHPFVTGNKWWKLKYNLEEAARLQKKTILTFGGAFSNHIYATAAAAHELQLNCIGIIRGEETLPLNPTLVFASQMNMKLHYVNRETYRTKNSDEFISQLQNTFGDFYMIPEGGSNALAVKGIAEFSKLLGNDFDYLCCPIGTGGTLAGLIEGLPGQKQIIGFSSLKGGDFLTEDIKNLLVDFRTSALESKMADKNNSKSVYGNWEVEASYHHGGYGKVTKDLLLFLQEIEEKTSIRFDPIYTGKMLFGIIDRAKKGMFNPGSTILAIHTGGLQGWAGINERYAKNLP
ncbi:MAG TPA: pyridoxal-phosphate dependent enzyme [Chryseolinea sp.]|nr:pyridoxal-phosphate dependent enzyme [Chryseolinea sp.]HPH45561.1 pyridoxal-phosphate dependent enzyme [Chryseolinea sp.]HPM28729.1 pyridoxal-phosphate dependent enzyme [Chryseolinea sp.]